MSDNITLSEGAGTLLATDEILGVHVLRAKLQTGVDGTAIDVSQDDPLPVGLVEPLPAGGNTVGAVNVKPATAGGLSVYRFLGLNSSGRSVKSSAGQVFGWHCSNTGGSGVFVKFYNTGAVPAVGLSPAFMTLYVPAGQAISAEHTNGIAFSSGIGIGATPHSADGDENNPAADTVVVNVFYK
ncbi:hypothetical protein [Sorangium sp. So ce887]|uniref:hypothetical protein n=1 Tax=Sorangium sp. So ce887 TaxID=3133324 RepID=UPI003F639109